MRMKEIGIKKVVGVSRWQLIQQYLTESMVLVLLAMTLALTVLELILPQFNRIIGKELLIVPDTQFWIGLLSIGLITGLIAGSYPAFYLSGFNPILVLKGKLHTPKGESRVRRGLVVFQFVISGLMIVSVWVIYTQIDYIQSKELGYQNERVLMIKREGALKIKA